MSIEGPTTDHSKGVLRVIVFVFLIIQVVALSGVYDLVSATTFLKDHAEPVLALGRRHSNRPIIRSSTLDFALIYARQNFVLSLAQITIAGLGLAAIVRAKSRPRHARSIISATLIVLIGFSMTRVQLRASLVSEGQPMTEMDWKMQCGEKLASHPAFAAEMRKSAIISRPGSNPELERARREHDDCLAAWDPDNPGVLGTEFQPNALPQGFWVLVQAALYMPILAYLYLGRRPDSGAASGMDQEHAG